MSIFLAAGQLAATQGTILAAQSQDNRVNVSFANTSATNTETINLLAKNGAGTARNIVGQLVLAPLESAEITNLPLDSADVLLANTTDATTVDYRVVQATGSGPFEIQCFDKNGNRRAVSPGAVNTQLPSGASTAAAGSTTTDAGVLPAGTGSYYPTTAANGTTGVRINAADQVTGRVIYVGNGAAAVLKIYAPSGGTINNGSADAAFSTGSGKGAWVICTSGSGNTWLANS